MSSGDSAGDFKEVTWPPIGFIYDQEFMLPAFCKPKLCPLKSITLEKLEKMQQESLERLKQIEEQQVQQAAESAAAATKKESVTDNVETDVDAGDEKRTDIWKADD